MPEETTTIDVQGVIDQAVTDTDQQSSISATAAQEVVQPTAFQAPEEAVVVSDQQALNEIDTIDNFIQEREELAATPVEPIEVPEPEVPQSTFTPEEQKELGIEQPVDTALATAEADVRDAEKAVLQQLDSIAQASDAIAQQQIAEIGNAFDQRANELISISAKQKAGLEVLGLRTGRAQFAPEIQSGIISSAEQSLVNALAELDRLEAQAVAGVKSAQASRDFELASLELGQALDFAQQKKDALIELQNAQAERDILIQEEVQKIERQSEVISLINQGIVDPTQIFASLEGFVPFDDITEITDSLPKQDQFTLSKGQTRFDANGNVIATGGGIGLGSSIGSGGSSVGTGGVGVSDFPTTADLSKMAVDERDFVNKVLRQLPTKLKDSEQEKIERQKEALFDFRRGRSLQEVVDEMNGFIVQDKGDQALGNVFRSLSIGSDLPLGDISAALNRGNDEKAMTAVENAQLSNVQAFFAETDKARSTVKQAQTVLDMLSDPDFPSEKLGPFDGRKFVLERTGFFGGGVLTSEETVKVQQLESALQLLNAPIRVDIVGVAATEAEMSKITGFQADILDQPNIVQIKVEELRDSVLRFHNEARSQRGLPLVDKLELVDNDARLRLYQDLAVKEQARQFDLMSNLDLVSIMAGESSTDIESFDQSNQFFWNNF